MQSAVLIFLKKCGNRKSLYQTCKFYEVCLNVSSFAPLYHFSALEPPNFSD